MNWFNKLQRKYRILITIVSWLPAFIVSIVVYSILGGNTNNITTLQSIIIFCLLIIGIIFTVFAILATKREKLNNKNDSQKQDIQTNSNNARFIVKNADGSVDISYTDGIKKHYATDEAKDIKIIEDVPNEDIDDDTLNYNKDVYDDVTITTTIGYSSGVDLPFFTKVVGATFNDCQENIKASKICDKLIIKHTPSNKYPESTTIINARTNKTLGHIKKDIAINLVKEFDKDFTLRGEIVDITGGEVGKSYGCNIKIIDKQ